MADVSTITDGFFITAKEGFNTTTSGTTASGATTVGLNSVAGYEDNDWVTLVIEPTSATNKQVFHGQINTAGSQVDNVTWTEGTNIEHTGGVTVVDYETATAWALAAKGLAVVHNDDGSIKTKGITLGKINGSGSGVLTSDGSGNVTSQASPRLTPRGTVVATTSTLTPNIDNYNFYEVSAQASSLTIANPTGTPNDFDIIFIRIKDNGSSRSIAYGSMYQNVSGADNLTSTTASKWHTLGIVFNDTSNKWQITSIQTEE